MSEQRTNSLVGWRDLRASARRISLQRESGTTLTFDANTKAQSFVDGVIHLGLTDLIEVDATEPWPTLVVRWRDRMGGTPIERVEVFQCRDAGDEAAFAEAIRRVVDASVANGRPTERGWLRLQGTGGKPIGTLGLSGLTDVRAHIVARVLSYFRGRVAKFDDPVVGGFTPTIHAFPSVQIAWDNENVVFGSVGNNALDVSTNGLSFAVDDITRIRLVEPWPRVIIEFESQGQTYTEKFMAQVDDELAFEAAVERITAVIENRAAGRVDAGWRNVAHVNVELVDAMPVIDQHGQVGGAFRTSAAAEAAPILAHYVREEAGVLDRLFGTELGPYEITVTQEHVYAALDRNVFIRLPLHAARLRLQSHGETFYIFGRATPLRIPNPEVSPIASILDAHVATQPR